MTQRMQAQYVQFYIDGSSAKQLNYVAPKKAEPERKQVQKTYIQKVKRILVDPVAIFGLVVAVCMIVTMVLGIFHLNTVYRDVQQMEEYVVYLQHQNKAVKNQYKNSYNLEEIEKTALALGMVPSDQVTHTQIDIPQPVVIKEPTIWENIGTFLTGLFA